MEWEIALDHKCNLFYDKQTECKPNYPDRPYEYQTVRLDLHICKLN